MPRHNPGPVLKIKYRLPDKFFRTKLTISGCVSNASSNKVMSIKKVSMEEIDKVGSYWHPFRDNDPESLKLRRKVIGKCQTVR